MNLETTSANNVLMYKKQMLNFLDETVDQKKLVFKQLIADIESLGSEIDRWTAEQKQLTAASAEKSLKDCLY